MPQNVPDIEIGGGSAGQERTAQAFSGWANGYGADNAEYSIAVSPIYNGPSATFMIDGQRTTVPGNTLRLRSLLVNHLSLAVAGATSDLAWTVGGLTTTDLTVTGNTVLGDSSGDTLTVNATAFFNANVTLGDAVGDAIRIRGTLTADEAATFAKTVLVTGAFTANGAVNLGDAAGDIIAINGTATFAEDATFNKAVTVKGNTALGDADADIQTSIGVWTHRNAANSATQMLVDAGNNRVVFGSATALGSDATPAVHVVGRLYVAPESANDFAFQVRRSSATAVGFNLGITSTNDFVFKDDGGNETFRVGDVVSTYQAKVTGAFNATGSATIGGGVSAGASSAFTGGVTVVTGGLTITLGGITVSAGGIGVTGSSVFNSGLSITGGLTLTTGSFTVGIDAGTANKVLHGGATPTWGQIAATDLPDGLVMRPIFDSVVVGAAVANIDATGLSGAYRALKIQFIGRSDTAATSTTALLRFNNDSGANYDYETLQANNATLTGAAVVASGSMVLGSVTGANAAAGVAGQVDADVTDYAGTTFQKMIEAKTMMKSAAGAPAAADMFAYKVSGYWRNAAAITRVTIRPGAGNWIAGSRLTIWGLPL